jgi:uncharacterized protein (TIGR03083 family)
MDVQDLVADQSATASLCPVTFFVRFAGKGFNFDRFADGEIARQKGATPAATLARYRTVRGSTSAPPDSKLSWLSETIVHSEDIRRPLGIAHTCPDDALRAVLDFYKGSTTLIGTKSRIRGLRLKATDQDWSHREGRLVEGPMLDLLLAATGRVSGCDGLSGDGADTLRARCG